jgi:hypothetical protein
LLDQSTYISNCSTVSSSTVCGVSSLAKHVRRSSRSLRVIAAADLCSSSWTNSLYRNFLIFLH